MVPSAYVSLDALPLGLTGKIDRKALPVPDAAAYALDQYVAPRTETEKALVQIWSELLSLGQEKIGINANFFALGGHSLLATRLVNLVKKRTGLEVSLRNVFESPTIAGLANVGKTDVLAENSAKVLEKVALIDKLADEELAELLS
jgi:hypothetical protein